MATRAWPRPWLAAAAAVLCLSAAPAPGARILQDVRILSSDDMQGRAIGTAGSAAARDYLLRRLRGIGARPLGASYEHAFTGKLRNGESRSGVNLLARIDGRGKSDRVLVVSAHYDHLGVREGQIYNGADDNASGVAALLAVAESFRRKAPEHTIVLALWDGEEGGLVGARNFVAAPPLPLSRVALNLNMDMVARGDKGELYVVGAQQYPFLKPRLEALAARAPVVLKLGHDGPPWTGSDDWTNSSDHAAFHEAKIPFAYFGVEDHADYHRPTDDAERIPADFFRRSVHTLITAARQFDRDLDAIAAESGR